MTMVVIGIALGALVRGGTPTDGVVFNKEIPIENNAICW